MESLVSSGSAGQRNAGVVKAVASGLGALRAARRPSKGSENALDTAQIAAVSSRLGWHVAFASIPASWRVPATARAVLLVVATEDISGALLCVQGLRGQDEAAGLPIVAILEDVTPASGPAVGRVLEAQLDLIACGVDDVVHNTPSEGALVLAASMAHVRCIARRGCHQRVAQPPGQGPVDSEKTCAGELSQPQDEDSEPQGDWSSPSPEVDIGAHGSSDALPYELRPDGVGEEDEDEEPVELPCLDGAWVATRSVDRDGHPTEPSQWLHRMLIRGGRVTLGDGGKAKIITEGGHRHLCGGELMLNGDTLVRRGRTGVRVEFARAAAAARMGPDASPRAERKGSWLVPV